MEHKIISGEKELKRLEVFLNTPGKRILLYHRDSDGVCSAALLLKFFSGFERVPRQGPRIEKDFAREIAQKKPDLLVFLDLPVDQEQERMREILEELPKLKVVLIDHHQHEADMNSERVVHINPRFFHEAYLSASCITYKLLESLGKEVSSLVWVSAIGIIGDYDLKDCGDLIKLCEKSYPGSLGKYPMRSRLSYASGLISSAVTAKGLEGAEKALEILLGSKDYEELLKSKRLLSWHKRVREETSRVIRDARKGEEAYPKFGLRIYTINTSMSLTSAISTYFGEKFPDKTVVIRKRSGGEWKISVRNQSGKVNAGDLAKKCVQGIGSGGGHKKAAGAIVSDWEKFRERLLEELKALKRK